VGTRAEAQNSGLLSHRLQVRFDIELLGRLRLNARGSGQSLSAKVRDLVCAGIDADRQGRAPRDESPAGLATLVAAEHAVLMVASVLPEGQRRMHELAPAAALAAEQRLAHIKESGL
jgi:hypothetical protein